MSLSSYHIAFHNEIGLVIYSHRDLNYYGRYCTIWVFSFGIFLKVFKTSLLRKGFYTLIKNAWFSSPTKVGSHNPSHSGPVSSQTLVPFSNRCGTPLNPPFLGPSVLAGIPPHVYSFGAQPRCWHIAPSLALM